MEDIQRLSHGFVLCTRGQEVVESRHSGANAVLPHYFGHLESMLELLGPSGAGYEPVVQEVHILLLVLAVRSYDTHPHVLQLHHGHVPLPRRRQAGKQVAVAHGVELQSVCTHPLHHLQGPPPLPGLREHRNQPAVHRCGDRHRVVLHPGAHLQTALHVARCLAHHQQLGVAHGWAHGRPPPCPLLNVRLQPTGLTYLLEPVHGMRAHLSLVAEL
mmetsp:Transcript_29131/g.82120  ORF Transcript_29131/g.82120 Transcript_29131/m.82120 type:complete len:215 (-) Transcript_29131:1519-2163(-)